MKKALTLVELLISIVLMGVIALGALAFDSASRSFLVSSESKTEVLNNLTYVLDHLGKNISLGIGNNVAPANQAVQVIGGNTVFIRQADRNVTYLFDTTAGNNRIIFNDGSSVTNLIDNSLISVTLTEANGGLSINNLVLRYRANEGLDVHANPQVSIDSQFFYPLSQSNG